MSGGGIIIQRFAALKPAAQDPSIYGSMSASQKAKVDAIVAKAPDQVTHDDVCELAGLIKTAVHT
jgi:hypothetical protein